MIEITRIIEWDMGHRVPNHQNKCKNPHGHRYRLELTVRGNINPLKGDSTEGMVCDFGDIKALLVEKIHDPLDHGFMMSESDELLNHWLQHNFNIIVVPFIPTAENIASWCYQQLAPHFTKDVTITRCRVFETPNCWADYYH